MQKQEDMKLLSIKERQIDCISSEDTTCTKFKEYITKDEEEILAEMRAIRKEAQELKDRINDLENQVPIDTTQPGIQSKENELRVLTKKLEHLKENWKRLDIQREEARHRKMVSLGHEEP
jgi:archaellum component FlaC